MVQPGLDLCHGSPFSTFLLPLRPAEKSINLFLIPRTDIHASCTCDSSLETFVSFLRDNCFRPSTQTRVSVSCCRLLPVCLFFPERCVGECVTAVCVGVRGSSLILSLSSSSFLVAALIRITCFGVPWKGESEPHEECSYA